MIKKTIFLSTIIFGVFFYNIQSKTLAVGQIPSECVSSYLSTDNPKTDHCNPACNRSNCITYCKNSPNGSKIKISNSVNSIKVAYKFGGNMGIHISIPELGIYNKNLDCHSRICKNSFTVKKDIPANSTLTIYITDRDGKSLGFRAPSHDNKCGENNICSPIGGTYGTVDITDLLNLAKQDNYQILSKECWADAAIGYSDFDFNDMEFVIAGKLDALCGNGILEKGEECDDGNTKNGDGCSATCQKEAICGNGVVEEGEECDDGNTKNGDGCSATCQKEAICGNGIVEKGEECDDGNTKNGDGCSATCQKEAICGNGIVEEGEGCDDGNTKNGDGCSASCKVEVKPKDTAGGLFTFIGYFFQKLLYKIKELFS